MVNSVFMIHTTSEELSDTETVTSSFVMRPIPQKSVDNIIVETGRRMSDALTQMSIVSLLDTTICIHHCKGVNRGNPGEISTDVFNNKANITR